MKLDTKRLTIRYFKNEDIDDFYEFSKNPIVGKNAGWKPHPSLEISKRVLFTKVISSNCFGIVLKESNKLIGSIELNKSHIRENMKSYEIGFALNPDYWGYGYIYEAASALIDFAFKKLKAEILEACHIIDNIRSENTIKSLGFTYEGTLVKYKEMYDKRIVDIKLYSLTKQDYERMNKHERTKNKI